MATTTINIRTDKEIKQAAEALFEELGMNMSTAINIFLRKAVRTNRIPFEVGVSYEPNDELKAAIEEGRRIARDPNAKSYTDVDELFAALEQREDEDEA